MNAVENINLSYFTYPNWQRSTVLAWRPVAVNIQWRNWLQAGGGRAMPGSQEVIFSLVRTAAK